MSNQSSPKQLNSEAEAKTDASGNANAVNNQASSTAVSDWKFCQINPRALARLAQGTSVVIASLLTIPDAVALLPNSVGTLNWALSVLGVWISAAVLWFVGFLGIMHGVRLVARGVRLDDRGIKLWHFARPIDWSNVAAVEIEPQRFFTRLFSLPETARRLTVFESKRSVGLGRKPGSAPHLVPHHVPSFFFAAGDFNGLFQQISTHKFAVSVNAANVLVTLPEAYRGLRSVHKKMLVQRVALPIIIALGLVILLGRKAIVNYEYNLANKEMAQGNLEAARALNAMATEVDPTFAPAWNNQANSEFKLGQFANAEKHWNKALFYKPDFVEAKVSLAYLRLQQRQFDQALNLIDRALNLNPRDPYALVNRSDCMMRTGHIKQAVDEAIGVLNQDPSKTGNARFMAACLLAQGKLLQGQPEECLQILDRDAPIDPSHLRFGQNLTFRLLVTAQTDLALNRPDLAEHIILVAARRAPFSSDVKLTQARIEIALHHAGKASSLIAEARKLLDIDPWPLLVQADLDRDASKPEAAIIDLKEAIAKPSQESQSLAREAELSLALGRVVDAKSLAERSLQLEPANQSALKVLTNLVSSAAVEPNKSVNATR